MKSEAKIREIGNSGGVIIPKLFLDNLNLKVGDNILIIFDKNKVIIKKA